jgi:transcriptional regulator with XRE-family HTH domain
MADKLDPTAALGEFIRAQRKLANLSLRQFAERTTLSNPYLSQLERGIHQPSLRVVKLIADALDLSVDTMLTQAGLKRPDDAEAVGVEHAIRTDPRLSTEQQTALLAVYRSMVSDPPSSKA